MPKQIPEDMGAVQRTAPTSAGLKAEPNRAEERLRKRAKRRSVSVARLVESPFQSVSRRGRFEVAELAESILALGLLNAPVVRSRPDGKYELISGHRRVFAWRLLLARGEAETTIAVDVLEDMSDLEAALAVRAANGHADVGPVAEAEETGRIRAIMTAELGRQPTLRDLAPAMPKGRTAVGEALEIWRALQDPRLEPLVRQADEAGKSLLVKALRAGDFSSTKAALEAFGRDGAASMRKALSSRRGRPRQVVTRRNRSEGVYDVTVRVRPGLTADEVEKALTTLEATMTDLLRVATEEA